MSGTSPELRQRDEFPKTAGRNDVLIFNRYSLDRTRQPRRQVLNVAGRRRWTGDTMSTVGSSVTTKTADDLNLPQWREQRFYLRF